MKKFTYLTLLVLVAFSSFAQQTDIALTSKYYPSTKSAQLKWFPSTKDAWMVGYEKGYDVFRTVVYESGKYVQNPVREKLNVTPLRLDRTKLTKETPHVEKIAMYMVADSLDEKLKQSKSPQESIRINESADLAYTFMVFFVAQNNDVAQKCGLMFRDDNVDATKKYVYEVEIHNKDFKSTRSWVEPDLHTELPKPSHAAIHVSDKKVKVSWDAAYYKDPFIGFNLYRSEKENSGFLKINKQLITVNKLTLVNNGTALSFEDSLAEYGKKYYYYITGVDYFEAEGAMSEKIEAVAHKKLENAPLNFGFEAVKPTEVKLMWTLHEEEKSSVKEVRLYSAQDPLATPQLLVAVNPKQLSFVDTSIAFSAYYTLCALGFGGEEVCDFPREVILRDTIPTAPPSNISATIDSNGVATLRWEKPKDKDLMGFFVYRNQRKKYEFNKLTATHIIDSIFVDSLNLDLLYGKSYYVVSAVDPFFNIAYSDTFELVLPDKHPPIAPVFVRYKSTVKGIELTWQNSSSDDVVQQILYRKGVDDINYRPIAKFSGKELFNTDYTDSDTKERQFYRYVILAYDASGLVSDTAGVLAVEQVMNPVKPKIENVVAIVSREHELIRISWEYAQQNIDKFIIYRAKEGEKLKVYKAVHDNEFELIEKSLTPNTSYSYRVVAEFKDGSRSAMSEAVVARY